MPRSVGSRASNRRRELRIAHKDAVKTAAKRVPGDAPASKARHTDAMDDTTEAPLLVACLCAEWCGTCRDYRAVLADAEARFGADAAFGWIDVEDKPDVQGALDIETFPTVLVARGDDVLFYGPLTPQASVLLRTIEKALAGDLAPVRDAALAGLAQRARDVLAA